MDLNLSPENEAFRQEVGDFVRANLPGDIRDKMKQGLLPDKEDVVRWITILNAKGWVAPAWPVEHGGTGWDTQQIYIFQEELVANHAPMESGFGTGLVAPVLIAFGSEEQKARYLPRILSFEDWWCQGYSEPNAGSDLAALSCRAIRDGDDYVVNGTKIWTTGAHTADKIFCLVRTSTEGKKQEGISFLLFDMNLPGITVKPILMFSGDHELNQVFFDDVRVPQANRVGPENKGWTVAKYLLEFERGGISYTPPVKAGLEKLKEISRIETAGSGGKLVDDPDFRRDLAKLETEITANEMSEKRVMSALSLGQNPGAASSMFKLRGSELQQRMLEMTMKAIGNYANVYQPDAFIPGNNVDPIAPNHAVTATAKYFNQRAATIYAGSSEVQRNIIAKHVLGL